ncbi:PilN domain-containing protein [Shewanella sp. FJAT-52076]|uniref:PilN domain-containing protein n=1 Tax=Shewanella sp. FJAT-52076 TaxID=2864202 RepID=UPI001C656C60|nr:PilN domain-containing protein [Shewanella sp. FJAT-52076]QYJ75853.1 PilN domain-containing protein [Shewanella sp. FJAT-52076]
MTKTRINLYDESLLPTRQRLNFTLLTQSVVAVLAILLLAGIALGWQLSTVKAELNSARAESERLGQQKQQLEAQLANHKADATLVAEVTELQDFLALKRQLLSELGNQQRFASGGYGSLMTDLASAADGNVWLERILVAEGELRFEGFAKAPTSVPLWVERLKHTQTLQGKQFSTMTMAREEGAPLGFILTSGALREEQKP